MNEIILRVLPDSVGHGASSKPSDGLHARFSRYDYADMFRAQYRLVTEALGVQRLRLIVGASMGGMHAWLWAVTYPDSMDAIVPMVYAWEASSGYDPSAQLPRIRARVLAINFEDDERNPPELGIMEREIARVARGRYVLIPASDNTRGHRSFYQVPLWKPYLIELLSE